MNFLQVLPPSTQVLELAFSSYLSVFNLIRWSEGSVCPAFYRLSTCHIQLCLLERQASSHFKCSLQSVINPLTQLRRSSCGPNSSFVIPAIEGLLACMLCPLLMCVDNCLWRTCHIAKVCRTGSSCSQTSLSPPSIRTQSLATTEEKKKSQFSLTFKPNNMLSINTHCRNEALWTPSGGGTYTAPPRAPCRFNLGLRSRIKRHVRRNRARMLPTWDWVR